jgi:hypothetical protein
MTDEPGEPRVLEPDDEEIRLPDGRISWIVSLVILAVSGAAVFGLLRVQTPELPVAGVVLLASLTAPFVSGARGHVAMDRVVPFAGMLGVLAIVYFNICLEFGSEGHFFPGRGHMEGALLYLMTFAGVPTVSVLGGVLGCVVDKKRRGDEGDDHLLM